MPVWRKALAPFILLLIVIGFFWKLTLTNQYSWLQSPDLAYQVVPWFQYQATQFHHGTFPIWDPYQYAGQSLIGQDQPGLAYPFNWILFLLPLRDGHINIHFLNWYYVSIHYFAALFCYLLVRDLGRNELSSVIAGIGFGLGGHVGNIDWPQMINGAIWIPLVFLFLFRVFRDERARASAAFCGFFLGVSWLGGHYSVPMFLSIAVLALWLYSLYGNRQLLAPFGIFLLFATAASAFAVWPVFAYGRTAVRWVGSQHDPIGWKSVVPYTVHTLYSLTPKFLLGVVVPGYDDGVPVYVGVTALALCGLALARQWQKHDVRLLFATGLGGLLFALGSSDVFHGILYSILPGIEKAREPMYAISLFHFAIAVLVGFGLDELMRQAGSTLPRKLVPILLGFGAVTFCIVFAAFIAHDRQWNGDGRVMIEILSALALAGLVYRISRAPSPSFGLPAMGLSILVVALYLIELGNASVLLNLPNKEDAKRNVYLSHLDETQQIADFLRHQPQPLRVWANAEDVPFNFGDWHGIDQLFGFEPSVPATYWSIEPYSQRGRQLYNAAYTISRKPLFADQKEIFRDSNGLAVYENPDVMPRAWTVHDAFTVKDAADARRRLQDPAFDMKKQTFLDAAPPAMDECDGDSVQSWKRETNQATAVVTMKCRGMVIISENYAPGWIAKVDGQPEKIYAAYTAIRGVIVGPGTHTIELRYRPLSVIAGGIATALAFLAAFGLMLRSPRKSKPPAHPHQAQY